MNKLDKYYEKYLSYHKKPLTRLMHVLGNLATVYYVYLCVMHCLWGLFAAPAIVYLFAWPSHWWIEKNKPAALSSWHNLFLSKICDWRMMFDMLRGRIRGHL